MSLGKFDFSSLGIDEAYNANGEKVNLRELKKKGYKIYADIGCGEGTDIFELASNNVYIVLVEIQGNVPPLLKHLERARLRHLPNIVAKTTLPENQPFSDHLFDRVDAHYVLTYTWEPNVAVKKFVHEFLRILDGNGLLVISGEFGHETFKKAEEQVLFKTLSAFEDYVSFGVRLPLSGAGRRHRYDNVTYVISKNQQAVEQELERLRTKRKEEIARVMPQFLAKYQIEWGKKAKIPHALKELIELWLATELEFILGIYKPEEKWKGYIMIAPLLTFTLVFVTIRKGEAKMYMVESSKGSFAEENAICTITKK